MCHPGLGSVWIFSPTGEPVLRIRCSAGLLPTNCAYGGPGGRTLYITESESGTILTADLEIAGQILYSHLE